MAADNTKKIFNSKEVSDLEREALKENMNIVQRSLYYASLAVAAVVEDVCRPHTDTGCYVDTQSPGGLEDERNIYETREITMRKMTGVLFQSRGESALREAFAKATDYTDEVLGNPGRYQPVEQYISAWMNKKRR